MRKIKDLIYDYNDIFVALLIIAAAGAIIRPLVLSGMDRIDVIANAMELRGFGKNRRRTWYMGRKFSKADIACILFGILLVVFTSVYAAVNGSRFWNPFV